MPGKLPIAACPEPELIKIIFTETWSELSVAAFDNYCDYKLLAPDKTNV